MTENTTHKNDKLLNGIRTNSGLTFQELWNKGIVQDGMVLWRHVKGGRVDQTLGRDGYHHYYAVG